MYDISSFYNAKTVEDAIDAVLKTEGSVFIAGGSDVLIKAREGKLAGCSLVSIRDIESLKGIEMRGGDIRIGPLSTFDEVEKNEIILRHIPMLSHAASQAGGPQLRHIGTIGGNICNGATSADTAPSLYALNAQLVIKGRDAERTLNVTSFHKGPGKVDLAPGELLTDIIIKEADYVNYGGCYIKYAMRNAMDIATLGCAAMCKLSGGIVESVRLAYGVANPTPVRCYGAEALAEGKPVTGALFEEVAKAALAEINPRTSWRASKEFRVHLAKELAQRALMQASNSVGGKL